MTDPLVTALPDPMSDDPPTPRRVSDAGVPHDYYADAVVARIPGFRELTLDLLRPIGSQATPVVVWIHGGAWLGGSHKQMPAPLRAASLDESLLLAGFTVAHVSYRLSGEACFPAQILDVRAAIRWLRRHSSVLALDPGRFGVWGESAGGHLAALACLAADIPFPGETEHDPDAQAVQAGVVWYGPSDFLTMQGQSGIDSMVDHDAAFSPEALLVGGPVHVLPGAAHTASPLTYARAQAPPMLLAHGELDRVVPAAQSEQLNRKLVEQGAPCELVLVPGADHCFIDADIAPLVGQAVRFFRDRLEAPAHAETDTGRECTR